MKRILIAGAGAMGQHHISCFSSLPNITVCGCVDHHPGRAKQIANHHSLSYYGTTIQQAIEATQPDGLVIATGDQGHADMITTALHNNLPWFCEKPLTYSWQEAQKLVGYYQQGATSFGLVNFSKRNAGAAFGVKQLLQEGVLGTIVHFEASYYQGWIPQNTFGEWRHDNRWLWRLRSGGNGILADLGSHLLDLISWYFGVPNSLSCNLQSRNKGNDASLQAPDSFTIQIDYANIQGTLQGSWWAGEKRDSPQCKIYGTKGWVEIDLEKQRHHITLHSLGETKTIAVPKPLPYREAFIRILQNKKLPDQHDIPDMWQGILIDYLIELCKRSSITGTRIYPKDEPFYKEYLQ